MGLDIYDDMGSEIEDENCCWITKKRTKHMIRIIVSYNPLFSSLSNDNDSL